MIFIRSPLHIFKGLGKKRAEHTYVTKHIFLISISLQPMNYVKVKYAAAAYKDIVIRKLIFVTNAQVL